MRERAMTPRNPKYKPRDWYWMHFAFQACAWGCWNDREDSTGTPPGNGTRGPRPGPLNTKAYFAQCSTRKEWLSTNLLWVSQSIREELVEYILGVRILGASPGQ